MTKSERATAIVTGSSRGVGASTAIKLASKGWNFQADVIGLL